MVQLSEACVYEPDTLKCARVQILILEQILTFFYFVILFDLYDFIMKIIYFSDARSILKERKAQKLTLGLNARRTDCFHATAFLQHPF